MTHVARETSFALIVGYAVLIPVLVVYLTIQRRRITALRKRPVTVREEADKRSERQSERLCALFDVSQVMGLESRLQTVFDSITTACLDAFNCDQASLMLFNKETNTLTVRSAYGHEDTSAVIGAEVEVGSGISGWVALHKKALVVGEVPPPGLPPTIHMQSKSLSSSMIVPILLRDELVGVVNVSSRSPAAKFDDEDLRVLQMFASNAGACIRHTEQAEWMRKTIRSLQEVPR